jgi:hypothetical protein
MICCLFDDNESIAQNAISVVRKVVRKIARLLEKLNSMLFSLVVRRRYGGTWCLHLQCGKVRQPNKKQEEASIFDTRKGRQRLPSKCQ